MTFVMRLCSKGVNTDEDTPKCLVLASLSEDESKAKRKLGGERWRVLKVSLIHVRDSSLLHFVFEQKEERDEGWGRGGKEKVPH